METKNGMQQGKNAKHVKICPCCEAKMTLHWHRLNKGLVNVLIKVRKEVIFTGKNEVDISKLDLTNTEFGNYNKLRYHGLIAKCKDKDGNRIGSLWLLTKRGNQFCKGLITVPQKVGTFRNVIRKKSTEFIGITTILSNKELPMWDSIETMDFEPYDVSDINEDLWDEKEGKLDN
jgi:hypothetical protein